MIEFWRTISGYENYEVSNTGLVRNKKRNKLLKQYKNQNGYFVVHLHKNGKQKEFRVHRLVALNLLTNRNNFAEVNHIDGNKENNYLSNLEWCSSEYNIEHEFKSNLVPDWCKPKKVIDTNSGIIYSSIQKASKLTGVLVKTISKACNHRTNSRWKFVTTEK